MNRQATREELQARVDAASSVIRKLLSARYPVQCGVSGGKDSVTVLNLLLIEAARLKAEGAELAPILVVHADTGIEHPQVHHLARRTLEQADAFAAAHGLDVRTVITQPNPASAWWVRIISGRKMPSYAGMNGDCTQDLKIDPVRRAGREFVAECRERGLLNPVGLLGTRFAESAARKGKMEGRNESDHYLYDEEGNHVFLDGEEFTAWQANDGRRFKLSPIAEWSNAEVFGYLQHAAAELNDERGFWFESFTKDFSALLTMYGSAAMDTCIAEDDPRLASRSCGGKSRFGCHTCLKVQSDVSMENMLWLPENEYMRPLNQMREFLKSIQWDLDRRRWIGRDFHPITSAVQVFPNCFNPETCELLLRALLSVDVRERQRAERLAEQIEKGLAADTPENRAMAAPQFQNITLEMIFLLDFYWGVDQFAAPFRALKIWHEVVVEGKLIDVPKAEAVPKPAAMPEVRWLPLPDGVVHHAHGSLDPIEFATTFEAEGVLLDHGPYGDAPAEVIPGWEDGECIGVDREAMELFMALELKRALNDHDEGFFLSGEASRRLLAMGVIVYPHAHRASLNKFLDRATTMVAAGLAGALDRATLESMPTISGAEHDEMILRDLQALGADVERLPTAALARKRLYTEVFEAIDTEAAGPLDQQFERALREQIACDAALAAGVRHFDGRDIKADRAAVAADVKRLRGLISEANVEAIERAVFAEAAELCEYAREQNEMVVDDGFGIRFALGAAALDVDTLRARSESRNQLDLFSQAA